jgi:drug/metabolite transporter (DMT)-like permease
MWLPFALLAAVFYAADNTIESLIVRHYEKNPFVITWTYGILSMPFLVLFPFVVNVQTPWMGYLVAFGMSAHLGDLFFTYIVDRLDISVVNAAWPILALLLSCVGFLFFGETWSLQQGIAALLIISGVFYLSFWHQHVSLVRTLCLLTILAAFFTPHIITMENALLSGERVFPVFFWAHVGNILPSLIVPWFFPSFRSELHRFPHLLCGPFLLLSALVVVCILLGLLSVSFAYEFGPLYSFPSQAIFNHSL